MYSLGIDFGTSGARSIVIDPHKTIVAESRVSFIQQDRGCPHAWRSALEDLLAALPDRVRSCLERIAINGTSGTVLLCNEQGQPVTDPLLYDDDRGQAVKAQLQELAPGDHLVQSSTSSLAKLLWWQREGLWDNAAPPPGWQLLHQADWLAMQLHGQRGVSDYHNALKLGYDVERLCYPQWLNQSHFVSLLPPVLTPGAPIAPVQPIVADRWGIPRTCQICTGTTDSIAAFLASGVTQTGEAVTSLGSTLVLKLLSDRFVQDLNLGIYSHRLGSRWLVGGASNTGGAVLSHFFTPAALAALSEQIDPAVPSGLEYYPLLKPGDRFPLNDPHLAPCLEPRPADPRLFLQGLLEGIARIEAQGYQCLSDRGAPPVQRVYTAGGGAQNGTWTKIRARLLGVPVLTSAQSEAAYGTALLGMGMMGMVGP
jgi:sugar (pentulose or hexulose) kinase